MNTFYGFKLGQTQDFDSTGRRWPITMVKVEPMTVLNQKQVSFGKYIREVERKDLNAGEKISVADVFVVGNKVKVTGVSKGKGFQGVVRRHGFKGGPKTHGQSDRQRHPGSIGQTTTPGRVYKGKKMAGHMGHTTVTVRNLQIFAVKPEENLLFIKGLVPGAKKSLLKITRI